MPFTRTNGIKDAADMCDGYVAPASCNTENPPTTFTPQPHATPTEWLATTGLDESFTNVALLIGAALIVAAIALFIVLAMRAKQKSNEIPSMTVCSIHDENHWPDAVHHEQFTFYPDPDLLKIDINPRRNGKTLPRIVAGIGTFYVYPNGEYPSVHNEWDDAVKAVREIHRGR